MVDETAEGIGLRLLVAVVIKPQLRSEAAG